MEVQKKFYMSQNLLERAKLTDIELDILKRNMPVNERPSEISIAKALNIFNELAMAAIDRKFYRDMEEDI